MASTRATKSKTDSRRKKDRKRRKTQTRDADRPSKDVEHVGQEPSDVFLREITKHAPWEVWANKLASRKSPLPLHKLMPKAGACPLVWSTGEDTSAGTRELLNWLYGLRRRPSADESPGDWSVVAEEWIDSIDTRPVDRDVALEAIAWAHGSPRLAVRLPAAVWSTLVARLVSLAAAAVGSEMKGEVAPERLVYEQLICGELPLALAYVFPKVDNCQQMSAPARHAIAEAMLASLDGEGFLQSRLRRVWPQLLGIWTRCAFLDPHVNGTAVSDAARLQFEWLIRQSLRCLRPDGTFVFNQDSHQDHVRSGLIKCALDVAGDAVDDELFALMRGRKKSAGRSFELPLAGEHSEWSELAILRTDWTRQSSYLAMSFADGRFESEFAVGPQRVWQGETMPTCRVDGTELETQGDWEELCWSSDADMEYIEFEIKLSKGWRLQRQILLVRDDQFLFAADVLLGPHAGRLEYRLELPINDRLDRLARDETTEVQLYGDSPVAWAHPLALSEWRTDGRWGRFDGRVLQQEGTGSGLYAPLFFDFRVNRSKKTRTWRQLTVGEDLRLVANDVAVAYRIQIGTRQWVVYRSLARKGNRTFLGQNVINEFVVARFDKGGELEEIIEIE